MTYCLGVDLGTTSVAAAVADGSAVEVLALGDRTPVIPAAVLVRDDGELVTGEAAARWAVSEPERVATQFTRRLGDPTPVLLGGTSYPLTDLLGALLRGVLARAAEVRGGPPEQVVLTHPAGWGRYRRELFAGIPRSAGLPAAVTVPESAAAAAYCAATQRLDEGDVIAVYDLGGGTFDATVLRRTPDGMEILGVPEGIERLGGADFDEAVLAHVNHATGGALAELDLGDPTTAVALARLRQDCLLAKEALSLDLETTVPVFLPGRHVVVRLTRSQFEDLVRAPVESTIGTLSRALRTAEVSPSRLSAVLLVGGSSRIPLVERMIAAEFGRPVVLDSSATHAVALGAALLAGARSDISAPAVPIATALVTAPGPAPGGAPETLPVPRKPTPAEALVAASVGAAAATAPVAAASPLLAVGGAGGAAAPPAPPPPVGLPPPSGGNGHGPAPGEALWHPPGPPAEDVPDGRRGALIAVASLFLMLVLGVVLGVVVLRDDQTPTASDGGSPASASASASAEPTGEAAPAPAPPEPEPAVPDPTIGEPIPVGPTPGFAVVSPDGRLVYVTQRDAGVVTVVDALVGEVVATIEIAAGPPRSLAMAPDGSHLYVSVFDDAGTVHAVDVIDTSLNREVATIPLEGRPYPGAVTPDGTRLFVPSQEAGTISVIDTTTFAIVSEARVPPDPHAIAFTADGRFAYVANHRSNVITELDTATLEVVASVEVGTSPHSLAINPVRPLVADVNYDSANVTITDTNTNTVVATVPVGQGPQHVAWSADGRFAYTANSTDDSVSVISTETFQETARLPVGDGPTSITVLPDGSRAFVTVLHEAQLVPLDLTG